MTWINLAARGFVAVCFLAVVLTFVAIAAHAVTHPDDDEDGNWVDEWAEGDAWDRGRDEWVECAREPERMAQVLMCLAAWVDVESSTSALVERAEAITRDRVERKNAQVSA